MPCNLRVKRRETFHRRGRGSRTECKNPLFWKLEMARSGIVMHAFGRSQAAGSRFGPNWLGFNMELLGVSFFSFGGFWHVLILTVLVLVSFL